MMRGGGTITGAVRPLARRRGCRRRLGRLRAWMQRADAVGRPGIVLDQLNAKLRPHGLWFRLTYRPRRATIGGMTGNGCSSRSIRRTMRKRGCHRNLLADGSTMRFGTSRSFGEC